MEVLFDLHRFTDKMRCLAKAQRAPRLSTIHAVCYIRDTLRGTISQISNENKEQRLVDNWQGRDKSPFLSFEFQDLTSVICILIIFYYLFLVHSI